MFALRPKFRPSRKPDRDGRVYYEISDGEASRCVTSKIQGRDKSILLTEKERIAFDLKTICCVIESLNSAGTLSVDSVYEHTLRAFDIDNPYRTRIEGLGDRFPLVTDLVSIPRNYMSEFMPSIYNNPITPESDILDYISLLFQKSVDSGKNISKSYRSLKHSLRDWFDGRKVGINELDDALLFDYSAYLSQRVSVETVSFYLRTLKNVFNNARREGLTNRVLSWGDVKTVAATNCGGKPCGKSIDLDTMRRIAALNLPSGSVHELVRDMFMFCYYAQGVELVDLVNLRPGDVANQTLRYRRRQKGRVVEVALGPLAMTIVTRYLDPSAPYLFPLMYRNGRAYKYPTVVRLVGSTIQEVGRMISPAVRLSFGMSRNTWFSAVKSSNPAEAMMQ